MVGRTQLMEHAAFVHHANGFGRVEKKLRQGDTAEWGRWRAEKKPSVDSSY